MMVRHTLGSAAVLSLVVALIAMPAASAAAPSPDSLLDRAATCSADTPVPEVDRPSAEIDARLQELHDEFDGVDGFVDVYYMPDMQPSFRAVFVETVPDVARLGAPSEVAFDVLPEAPEPTAAADEDPSVDDVTCGDVRPGTWVDGCTASWVFTDTQGNLYIGSAGHCFFEGENVLFGDQTAAGTVVFRMANGIGSDFALIEVGDDFENRVSAKMCGWGGPTGGNQDGSILGEGVVADGHGRTIGFPGDSLLPPRPRAGVGVSWGATSFMWAGSMLGGDSGAPVMEATGEALGTHTHSLPGPDATAWGTRWDVGMQAAEDDLGIDLTLATSDDVHLQPN